MVVIQIYKKFSSFLLFYFILNCHHSKFRKTHIYYDPLKLVELLGNEKNSEGALAQFDVACYASRVRDADVYMKSRELVFTQFENEKKKVEDGNHVVYSTYLTSILSKIAVAIGNESRDDYLHNYNGIISILYDQASKTLISKATYDATWEMVNWAVYGNNYKWFTQYWTFAEQYYRFFTINIHYGPSNPSAIEFYQRHIMVGVLLVFLKKFSWLRHIMKYTQTLPPSYKLIPGTMTQINQFSKLLSGNDQKAFLFISSYQFMNLDQGARTEDIIIDYTYSYLALLFIRIWSYKDYNINYCDPLILPNPDEESQDKNKNMIEAWEHIQKKVEDWYVDPTLKEFNFNNLPNKDVVISKIDEFKKNLELKNAEINNREEFDFDKIKKIADELIYDNYNWGTVIPIRSMSGISDKAQSKRIKICGCLDIERQFVLKGSTKEIGGAGKAISEELKFDLKSKYFCFLLKNINHQNVKVSIEGVLNLIDQQGIDNTYVIVSWKDIFENYNFRNYIKTDKDGILSYNGIQIFELGLTGINAGFIILKKSELPYGEVVKSEEQDTNMEPIDKINLLYSNIYCLKQSYNQSKQSYKICTQQTVNIHYIQGANGTLVSII